MPRRRPGIRDRRVISHTLRWALLGIISPKNVRPDKPLVPATGTAKVGFHPSRTRPHETPDLPDLKIWTTGPLLEVVLRKSGRGNEPF